MIGVVLVDDHAVVREGYRALLSRQHDIDVVAEYGDADAAWRGMARTAPDIVIMDLNMPGASAIDVLARLHRQHACLRSLVFTMYVNPTLARRAFAAGARGFVTKSSAPDVLLAAVRRIAAGGR
ncbi:MAG: response regulator transcription factor, partial [Gammaproteobacteria bacterium]